MASFDEVMKRQALARQPVSAQMSPLPNTEIERQRVLFENRMNDAAAMSQRSRNQLNDALALAQQPVAQATMPDNFLTRKSKNPVLGMLQGLVSQRLIDRGLMQDPLDVARSNLINRQNREQQLQNLSQTSELLANQAQRQKQSAFRSALAAGLKVDPTLALSDADFVSNQMKVTGADMGPVEQQELINKQLANLNTKEQRERYQLTANAIFDSDTLSDATKFALLASDPDEIDDRFSQVLMDSPIEGVQTDVLGRQTIKPGFTDEGIAQVRLFGRELTGPETRLNKLFSDEANEFIISGYSTGRKKLGDLSVAIDKMVEAIDAGSNTFSGPFLAQLPDFVRVMLPRGEEGIDARGSIRSVLAQSFREILGGQFAFLEGEKIIQNSYDENLPPEYNLRRIRRLFDQLKEIHEDKLNASNHMLSKGTLFGTGDNQYKGWFGGDINKAKRALTDEFVNGQANFDMYSVEEIGQIYAELERNVGTYDSAKAELDRVKDYIDQNRSRFVAD